MFVSFFITEIILNNILTNFLNEIFCLVETRYVNEKGTFRDNPVQDFYVAKKSASELTLQDVLLGILSLHLFI